MGGRGEWGTKSYDLEKSWPSINRSIFSEKNTPWWPRTLVRSCGGVAQLLYIIQNIDNEEILCRAFRHTHTFSRTWQKNNEDCGPASLKFGSGSNFHFNADPDAHQSDGNIQPLVYRPSFASFWASTPLLWATTAPFWANFSANLDPDLASKNNADPYPHS